ncbi:molybdopterin-dependent oxidoreductase [Plantactinospora sp. B6F1]|uniref:molybdopterin-dependent oxidoreductase n=1 Tax=Plantactinospora sp. B6F1 TaxID=3158971 RepID=UPI0032D98B1B
MAVFNGIARALLDNDHVDQTFIRHRASGFEELTELLRDYPLARAAQLAGVDPATLDEAARLYGNARLPAIVYGLGITEHAHGTDGVRTLANLAILKGAVGTPDGCGILTLRGQNNVQGASDTRRVQAALAACDLVVCHDLFLSRTAEHADVVLPAVSSLEKDGTFVNFERRVRTGPPSTATTRAGEARLRDPPPTGRRDGRQPRLPSPGRRDGRMRQPDRRSPGSPTPGSTGTGRCTGPAGHPTSPGRRGSTSTGSPPLTAGPPWLRGTTCRPENNPIRGSRSYSSPAAACRTTTADR